MKFLSAAPLVAAALFSLSTTPAHAAGLRTTAAPDRVAASALNGARDLGHAIGSRVDFTVVLPYQHAAELPALLAAQADPNSKFYRHFLTSAAFRNYFSPTAASYNAAALVLKHAGFAVEAFPNRTALHATGTAGATDALFHTVIDAVRQADGRLGYANVAAATIPAGLAGARVVGLTTIVTAQTATSQIKRTLRPAATVGGPLFGPDGGFGPLAIAAAEDFPIEHGYTGRNSNVADIIDGAVTDTDVAGYLSGFGLKRNGPRTTIRIVDGGCGANCFDGYTAVADAEGILGVAPGASLFTYEIPSLANGYILDAFNALVSDNQVNIVNFSVGFCEVAGDLELALEPVIAQGAAQGISFESVAFGGANLCGLGTLGLPMAPANLDTVTAVGGSSTFTDTTGKQLAQSAFSGTNGGVSYVIPAPQWQMITAGTSKTGRNVPDVVLPGSVDGVGPSVYFGGAWVGGYSFVDNAPFAGYLATVQEIYGYATPLGNPAPALYTTYRRAGYTGKKYFTDVALGCIGSIANVAVCAKPGYDVASGIGSMGDAFALAKSFGYGAINPPTK